MSSHREIKFHSCSVLSQTSISVSSWGCWVFLRKRMFLMFFAAGFFSGGQMLIESAPLFRLYSPRRQGERGSVQLLTSSTSEWILEVFVSGFWPDLPPCPQLLAGADPPHLRALVHRATPGNGVIDCSRITPSIFHFHAVGLRPFSAPFPSQGLGLSLYLRLLLPGA